MPSNNFIHAGGVGGGVVPQLDAPHSASNAGDRVSWPTCLPLARVPRGPHLRALQTSPG